MGNTYVTIKLGKMGELLFYNYVLLYHKCKQVFNQQSQSINRINIIGLVIQQFYIYIIIDITANSNFLIMSSISKIFSCNTEIHYYEMDKSRRTFLHLFYCLDRFSKFLILQRHASVLKIYLFVLNNDINNKGLWTKKSYFLIFIEDGLRKKGEKRQFQDT